MAWRLVEESVEGDGEMVILTIYAFISLVLLLVGALDMLFGDGTFTIYFRWYDLWMGVYYDRKNGAIYFGIAPMIGVRYER